MPEGGSFTIEFFLHLPRERWGYFLQSLQSEGVKLEEESSNRFRIICETPRQIAEVGRWLFHTHFDRLGHVVGTTGEACPEASAYHHPRTRAERKRYRG